MSKHEPDSDFTIDFAAKPDLLVVIRDSVRTWCQRSGVATDRADRVGLAVDEAVANIIRHAYDGDPNGRIRLVCTTLETPTGHELEIVLDDCGKQVDIEQISPRDLDDVRPGGLGVHLIKQIMDRAQWSHRAQGGTRLTMHVAVTERTQPTSRDQPESHREAAKHVP